MARFIDKYIFKAVDIQNMSLHLSLILSAILGLKSTTKSTTLSTTFMAKKAVFLQNNVTRYNKGVCSQNRINTTKKALLQHCVEGLKTTCGRWDLNPHVVTDTRSLVLPVCQFQHFRICNTQI